jgi:hypothetical protein
MPGIPQVRRFGDLSLPAGEAIAGGQLVAGDNSSGADHAVVAGAGSAVVLGVARFDCAPPSDPPAGVVVAVPAADRCTVTTGEVPVTYAAAAAVGQKLVAAADGQVTPYDSASGNTADEIVGYCTASTAAGAVGRAYIG